MPGGTEYLECLNHAPEIVILNTSANFEMSKTKIFQTNFIRFKTLDSNRAGAAFA